MAGPPDACPLAMAIACIFFCEIYSSNRLCEGLGCRCPTRSQAGTGLRQRDPLVRTASLQSRLGSSLNWFAACSAQIIWRASRQAPWFLLGQRAPCELRALAPSSLGRRPSGRSAAGSSSTGGTLGQGLRHHRQLGRLSLEMRACLMDPLLPSPRAISRGSTQRIAAAPVAAARRGQPGRQAVA